MKNNFISKFLVVISIIWLIYIIVRDTSNEKIPTDSQLIIMKLDSLSMEIDSLRKELEEK